MPTVAQTLRAAEAQGVRQHRGDYTDAYDLDENTGGPLPRPARFCALGALAIATEGPATQDDIEEWYSSGRSASVYPEFRVPVPICPRCGAFLDGTRELGDSLIPHLNDDHGLSFGQIADYVEALLSEEAP